MLPCERFPVYRPVNLQLASLLRRHSGLAYRPTAPVQHARAQQTVCQQQVTGEAVGRKAWQQQWQPFKAFQDTSKLSEPDGAGGRAGLHARFVQQRLAEDEMLERARGFRHLLNTRRSVRFFSEDVPPLEVVQECIRAAGTAPSGAHLQPWTFVVVRDLHVRQQVRTIVEEAEKVNYEKRMGRRWVDNLHSIVGDLHRQGLAKPYLTQAPYLILQFEHKWQPGPNGEHLATYYSTESNGIASGLLQAALHNAGLCTFVSTPMGTADPLAQLLQRPAHERLFLLMPVGYAAHDCTVPYRTEHELRKPLEDILCVV